MVSRPTLILLLLGPREALACLVEYSDWLIDAVRSQGVNMEKRVCNFATLAECEAARQDAIQRSGDPGLANNMRCVDCPSTTAQPLQEAMPPSNRPEGSTLLMVKWIHLEGKINKTALLN